MAPRPGATALGLAAHAMARCCATTAFQQPISLTVAYQELASNNVPIAGFNAGPAIFSKDAFAAESGSIRLATAKADPFNEAITLSQGFPAPNYLHLPAGRPARGHRVLCSLTVLRHIE